MNINIASENDLIKSGIAPRTHLVETKLSPQVIHLDQPGFNTSYGYDEIGTRRGYTPPPINESTLKQATFKYNPTISAWTYSENKGRGKTVETPVAPSFTPPEIMEIYDGCTGKLKAIILTYTANGRTYSNTVPGEDCSEGKYSKHITGVERLPGCTKSRFNEFWSFLVRTSLNIRTLRLYAHQGWNLSEDGTATFVSAPVCANIPIELFPISVLRRKPQKLFVSAAEVISRWAELYSKHPTLKFLSYFRIGSLLQFFLNSEGVYIKQIAFIEPSEGISADKLKSILATNDIKKYPAPRLESNTDKVLEELRYVYDGIAVFIDNSFADEENKVRDSIKTLIKAIRRNSGDTESSIYMVAVISENAAHIASRLAPENVITLKTDGISISETACQIEDVTDQMDSLIIKTIENRLDEARAFIKSKVAEYRDAVAKYKSDYALDTLVMLFVVDDFLEYFLGMSPMNNDDLISLLPSIDDTDNHLLSVEQIILNDFAGVLSSKIRSGELRVVKKRKNMIFDSDGSALLNGERLYISKETLDMILTDMKSTHAKNSLIKALKRSGLLDHTDECTHPVELHDVNGQHKRLYMYDISIEILDADVINTLNNLEGAAFLLSEDDIPKGEFIPILNDGNGHKIGKLMRCKDLENRNFYICGQSGYGKTYMMLQLMAKNHKLGHRVVAFDNSDSFSKEAFSSDVSERFVEENVHFHDLDKDGIPIDPFRINRSAGLPSQKSKLLGVITAGIGKLSSPQSNMMRAVLSKLLSKLDKNEPIRIEKILSVLNDETGASKDSLLNCLCPLFEDIDNVGVSDSSWGDVLTRNNKILVLRTNSLYTEKGSQIIDMMLASLYNWQVENPTIPLDIFIDELQNQNFSETSPIRKILKEGRKKNLSFYGSTQDFYPRNTEIGSTMGIADTQCFLKPTPNSEKLVASELRFNKADMARFDSMMRGDVILKGSLYNKKEGRNSPTIISGHIDDFPKLPGNYYGNVR